MYYSFLCSVGVVFALSYSDNLLSKFDLNDAEYIAKLKTMITACNYYDAGARRSVAGATVSQMELCDKVDYLLEVHKIYTSHDIDLVVYKSAKKAKKKADNWNVKKLDKDSSQYSKVFQEYIIPGRPFIATFDESETKTINNMRDGLFDACMNTLDSNEVSLDIPLRQCVKDSTDLDPLIVSKFVLNNYIIRLNPEWAHDVGPLIFTNRGVGDTDEGSELGPVDTPHSAKKGGSSSSSKTKAESLYDSKTVDLLTQWPAVVPVKSKKGTIHKCPDDMHQLLWSPSASGSGGGATIRLLSRRDEDFFGKVPHANTSNLHYPSFQRDAFSLDKEVKFVDVKLGSGETLFVPNSFYVGIQEGGEEETTSLLLRMCFVDASNYKAFLNSLSLSAKVSDRQRDLLERLRDMSAEDKVMDREPVDMSFKEYALYPRTATVSTVSNVDAQSSVDEAADSSVKKNKKQKRKKGSSATNFRNWQESTRWHSLTHALTIPQADVSIREIGRRNVTLHVAPHFAPLPADKTYYGFNVTVCRNSNISYVGGAVKLFDNCTTLHMKRDDKRVKEINPTWLDDVSDTSANRVAGNLRFQLSVTDLEVSTDYRFRVCAFYDSNSGPFSVWTTAATTQPITPPSPVLSLRISNDNMRPMAVQIVFSLPIDDGGLPIRGYRVYGRCREAGIAWFLLHAAHTAATDILLQNLLSNASYEFRVVAFNDFGECDSSPYVDDVTTYAYDYFLAEIRNSVLDNSNSNIHGKGLAVGYYESDVEAREKEARHGDLVISKVVTLNTNDQTVYVTDSPLPKVTGWLCHWSMNLTYNVISEAVWAQPATVDSPLTNSDDLRGRIAVVLRGGVTVAHKAMMTQRAGALAMVVVDMGDLCIRAFDQKCVPGSDKSLGMGFASIDIPEPWSGVRIPIILIAANAVTEELFSAALLRKDIVYTVEGSGAASREGSARGEEL